MGFWKAILSDQVSLSWSASSQCPSQCGTERIVWAISPLLFFTGDMPQAFPRRSGQGKPARAETPHKVTQAEKAAGIFGPLSSPPGPGEDMPPLTQGPQSIQAWRLALVGAEQEM